ncbi:MAG TPA: DUF2971 domain-containing protein [Thermoanaerobaculia bacterium]|nr:DUF2971 domain-containing protein [Thermoanaerobaculia bacterium]
MAQLNAAADGVNNNHRRAALPQRVFHYTSLPAALDIVASRQLWCSNTRYSNDPSESDYGQKLIEQVIRRDPHFKFTGLLQTIRVTESYATSFSADPDLQPQWRAYCLNGRGLAVGVGTDTLLKRKAMIFMRVEYVRRAQSELIRSMLDVFRQAIIAAAGNQSRLGQLLERLALGLIVVRAALKNRYYESEREYRLIDAVPANSYARSADVRFRATTTVVAPYLVADLTQSSAETAREPIEEVRVGPCLNYELVASALQLYCHKHRRRFEITKSKVRMRCE